MKIIIGIFRFITLWICIMLLPLSYIGLGVSIVLFGYSIYIKNSNMLTFAFIGFLLSYAVWYLFKCKNWLGKAIDILDK